MTADFERNRRAWDAGSDAYQARHREQLSRNPTSWGVWSLPEDDLRLLGDVAGLDVLEFGCGAAQWSIGLAKRGARAVALDNSARQLEHARTAIEEAGVDVRLVHAAGEHTPFAPATFDVVFSDHGAMSFASPNATIPEVARILRSGGIFAFNVEHPIHAVTWDDAASGPSREVRHPYFTLDRNDDPLDGSVNFTRPVSTYVELLLANGFTIERMIEPRPPAGTATTYGDFATEGWARDFPAELMIRARRTTP